MAIGKLYICVAVRVYTLSVSNQFIQSALDKYDKSNCEKDFRGRHNNKNKVCTAAIIKGVCDHVNSFQPVESHYTRKDTNKVYLDDLNFSTMIKTVKIIIIHRPFFIYFIADIVRCFT